MLPDFSLFPESASTFAGKVDGLFFFILFVTLFFSVLIAILLVYFAIRYRRRSETEIPKPIVSAPRMESAWLVFLFVLFISIFFWGAITYFSMARPPDDAIEVYVVGKQWMWKVQHPEGVTEINELTIPVGQPVRLVMTSEDVIHDFYIPAFRTKQDVLPGRYSFMWFQATKPGRYRLFCAEYCGTDHSRMGGWVVAMEQSDYEKWLASSKANFSMAQRGEQLFLKHQCITCHTGTSQAKAPSLENLFGKKVTLQGGRTVEANEDYIARSIRDPKADIVDGYRPIMPAFPPEQLDDLELQQLIEFIKALKTGQTPARNEETPAPENKDVGP
jgi:cytochrome c oxidase subunit 2